MQRWRFEANGTVAWLCWTLLLTTLATGCHGDTNQGGGADQGRAEPKATQQQLQQPVPTPPTADQIDPDSPRAVLNGTSTTRTTMTPPAAGAGASGRTGQPPR